MIRIVSWNIELGMHLDRAAHELSTDVDLRGADIVLLQEMDPDGTRRLADALDMRYRYGAPAEHPKTGQRFGNAVLSPWPMSEGIEVALPYVARVQGQPRSAVGADIEVAGTVVSAYSVHIETVLLATSRRSEQVATVAQALPDASDRPVVIGGDFNTASKRSFRHFEAALGAAGLSPITPPRTPTFRRFGRGFTLDHIFAKHVTTTSSGVVEHATASDHKPTWAVVSPTSVQPGR